MKHPVSCKRPNEQHFGIHELDLNGTSSCNQPVSVEEAGANSRQVGGNHYRTPIQPWDFILANDLGFLEGNAVKYISRHRKTPTGKQDLEKAIHYLQKVIEFYYDPKKT